MDTKRTSQATLLLRPVLASIVRHGSIKLGQKGLLHSVLLHLLPGLWWENGIGSADEVEYVLCKIQIQTPQEANFQPWTCWKSKSMAYGKSQNSREFKGFRCSFEFWSGILYTCIWICLSCVWEKTYLKGIETHMWDHLFWDIPRCQHSQYVCINRPQTNSSLAQHLQQMCWNNAWGKSNLHPPATKWSEPTPVVIQIPILSEWLKEKLGRPPLLQMLLPHHQCRKLLSPPVCLCYTWGKIQQVDCGMSSTVCWRCGFWHVLFALSLFFHFRHWSNKSAYHVLPWAVLMIPDGWDGVRVRQQKGLNYVIQQLVRRFKTKKGNFARLPFKVLLVQTFVVQIVGVWNDWGKPTHWHPQNLIDFSFLGPSSLAGPSSFAAIAQVCGPGHPKLWVQLVAGRMGAHWLEITHDTYIYIYIHLDLELRPTYSPCIFLKQYMYIYIYIYIYIYLSINLFAYVFVKKPYHIEATQQ